MKATIRSTIQQLVAPILGTGVGTYRLGLNKGVNGVDSIKVSKYDPLRISLTNPNLSDACQ